MRRWWKGAVGTTARSWMPRCATVSTQEQLTLTLYFGSVATTVARQERGDPGILTL